MGWTLYLTLNKKINEDELDNIIKNYLDKDLLLGFSEGRNQLWGWE